MLNFSTYRRISMMINSTLLPKNEVLKIVNVKKKAHDIKISFKVLTRRILKFDSVIPST